ncbi:formate dehydrogenase [Thecamonas trahens ATCC 50062]|uniref:Formate dehydrogenase n=1 Tax=Thecamonas trahens ATCC 50062 TaxID=461836 RepID=A0A0L0DB06_THETB|nr:formate dehydrogenase [Thecamonas trahens ATCC 50062]KNC49534.1 formate dehydrogenase [Thecamonas trahens ATCC 50062]|eukprot:XP_013757647.1 formate dehydrogenase [Thecamonas trahens ATCC 50062]
MEATIPWGAIEAGSASLLTDHGDTSYASSDASQCSCSSDASCCSSSNCDGSCSATVAAKPPMMRTPEQVIRAMAESIDASLDECLWQWIVRGVLAGVLITTGAFLSTVFSAGVEAHGPQAFMAGLGFVTAVSMVILSGSLLLSASSITIPMYLLARGGWDAAVAALGHRCGRVSNAIDNFQTRVFRPKRAVAMWLVSIVANYLGSLFAGALFVAGSLLDAHSTARLDAIVLAKVSPYWASGARGWFSLVVWGMIANLLVGMAAYNATVARTLPGIVLGIFLPVMAFVVLGAAHSPTNMGYFALSLINGNSPITWGDTWAWHLPAAIAGNLLGGALLIGLPIFLAHGVSPTTYRTKIM